MSNPAIYDNRQRDGISSLRELARRMCMLVNTFGPIIELKYRNNPGVLEALNWARTACTMIPSLDEVSVITGDNDVPTDNPELIPGVNPSAPPPPAEPS